MIKQPKKWWFLIPVPTALLISFAIWEIRMCGSGHGGSDGFLEAAGLIAVVGAQGFPIGLPGTFLPQEILHHYFWYFVCGGYILYLALSIMGAWRPSKGLLLTLCVLLILNMVGCQMEHTVSSLPLPSLQ